MYRNFTAAFLRQNDTNITLGDVVIIHVFDVETAQSRDYVQKPSDAVAPLCTFNSGARLLQAPVTAVLLPNETIVVQMLNVGTDANINGLMLAMLANPQYYTQLSALIARE